MKYYRCKCGKAEAWGSMGPRACQGCKECGTTLNSGPDGHRTPEPHEWVPQYNPNTGVRESDVCKDCMAKRINEEGILYEEQN